MTEVREVSQEEIEVLIERFESGEFTPDDLTTAVAVMRLFQKISIQLELRELTLKKLRKMIFGSKSEKSDKVNKNNNSSSNNKNKGSKDNSESKEKPKGHGKNGASDYPGAEKVEVKHSTLKAGDPCPVENCTGTLYIRKDKPGIEIRITGRAPFTGKVYILERLRCNTCSTMFTADLPEDAGENKYDETAASVIGNAKYGYGLPFNRLSQMQEDVGVPLPASTQWELVDRGAVFFLPVFNELIKEAAQGELFHNDDTPARILEILKEQNSEDSRDKQNERKGLFTSGIISIVGDNKIALFFTGRRHAGENLEKVLQQRAEGLGPPLQMCDALNRNIPKNFEVILSNCSAHARRKFVDIYDHFPDECEYVLDVFKAVYKNDATSKAENMSPEKRLVWHQEHSKPLMDDLSKWLAEQFDQKLIEPNSSLGKAISYMQNHWKELTLFLREPGAAIDNNIVERVLRKAVIHRNNSLFFKTENGAYVGDIYMSLIQTCKLCKANPFDYLNNLQTHATEVRNDPSQWMPWNYKQCLAACS